MHEMNDGGETWMEGECCPIDCKTEHPLSSRLGDARLLIPGDVAISPSRIAESWLIHDTLPLPSWMQGLTSSPPAHSCRKIAACPSAFHRPRRQWWRNTVTTLVSLTLFSPGPVNNQGPFEKFPPPSKLVAYANPTNLLPHALPHLTEACQALRRNERGS